MQKNNRKIVLAMAYIGAMLLSSPLQSAVPELDPELISALQAKGSVRVIVTFARQQGRAFDRTLPDNQRIQQISEVRDQILRDLAGQAVPRRTFLMVPGFAPAASIVSVKVLDSSNSFCCLSDVIAAFDWVRVNHADTSVLNASLGTFSLFTGSCDAASTAMTSAVENLVANGTMVFVSSGNQASSTQTALPACIESSISVGALWDAPRDSTSFLGCTDSVVTAMKPTCFTNSNNTVDLFAPGAFISSSGRGGTSSTFGGTSQASPMSAGCAASE